MVSPNPGNKETIKIMRRFINWLMPVGVLVILAILLASSMLLSQASKGTALTQTPEASIVSAARWQLP